MRLDDLVLEIPTPVLLTQRFTRGPLKEYVPFLTPRDLIVVSFNLQLQYIKLGPTVTIGNFKEV